MSRLFRGKFAPLTLPRVAGVALVAALATVVTRWVDQKFSPVVEYLIVFLILLVAVIALHVLMAAARTRWASGVADVLKGIAEGRTRVDKGSLIDLTANFLYEDLQSAIKLLKKNIVDLRERNRRAEAVVTYTANGVLSVDFEGRITVCNPAAEKMFGRKKSSLLGHKIEDCDLHPELARLAYECMSSEAPLQLEIKLPGWPLRVIAIRAVAVHGTHSSDDSAMIVIQDMSEVRRRQMHEREFVGNVSHEFRTPITAVRTTAEALISGAKNDPEVVDKFLNTIITESERLSALIDDLLELAKRDYGIAGNQKAHVSIAEIIERAVEITRPLAQQKDIFVNMDVPDDLVEYCDETQMAQLVRNLVDNAIKYTPEGGRVEVTAREDDFNVVISVKDTGIGIPHGEIDRIFERFYRIDKARSRRMGGTGLGLAIVKDIVDSYGGTINVDTQLGSGSTFTITLPLRMVHSESGATESSV